MTKCYFGQDNHFARGHLRFRLQGEGQSPGVWLGCGLNAGPTRRQKQSIIHQQGFQGLMV
jgi:hypothetical protein